MRRYGIALAVVLVAAAVFTVVLLAFQSANRAENEAHVFFDGRSSQEAYALFVEYNSRQSPYTQHRLAHVFGEALFKRDGIAGFAVCGTQFGYGCYHSFFGSAIARYGLSVVEKLEAACGDAQKRPLGCYHGIGHGLVAYFGYDEEDLDLALSACESLTWHKPYGGCADGAFMEYNLRTMLDTEGSIRTFLDESPYAPCDSLERFREACFFSIGEWWRESLRTDANPAARAGELCAELADSRERQACYRGVGYAYAVQFDFVPKKGTALCNMFGKGSVPCTEGFAWALFATGNRTEAQNLCEAEGCNYDFPLD